MVIRLFIETMLQRVRMEAMGTPCSTFRAVKVVGFIVVVKVFSTSAAVLGFSM
jgi:hypothetical protein